MRNIAFFTGIVLISLLTVGCKSDNKKSEDKLKKRPNIIFFLADDMRWDAMGCAGNTIIQTPNLDRLAQSGAMFSNTFVTTSICACSRASILTGQYVSKHGIDNFYTPLSNDALSTTYPILLKESGYSIGFIGKYGIGKKTEEVEKKFDYFWGSAGQPDYENVDENGDFVHYTDWVGQHVNEFLETTKSNKPFCLSVSFKAPHCQDSDPRQFIYNERYDELYKNITIPEEKTNTEAAWDRFPEFFKENNEARKRWEMRFSTPQQYQEMVKDYYRLVNGIDDVVGEVRQKLKKMGIEANTILIFTSDNGFYLGEHGLAGKWYGHEPSIRVPLIISDPRHKELSGTIQDEMVLNIDIAPTILSYAGVSIPEGMQGKNINSLFNGTSTWRESFYYEHTINQFKTIPVSMGFRSQRYKYLIYPE
ncbi:MAG: sulfatase family protein, partial [Bacteroidota bacterium]